MPERCVAGGNAATTVVAPEPRLRGRRTAPTPEPPPVDLRAGDVLASSARRPRRPGPHRLAWTELAPSPHPRYVVGSWLLFRDLLAVLISFDRTARRAHGSPLSSCVTWPLVRAALGFIIFYNVLAWPQPRCPATRLHPTMHLISRPTPLTKGGMVHAAPDADRGRHRDGNTRSPSTAGVGVPCRGAGRSPVRAHESSRR